MRLSVTSVSSRPVAPSHRKPASTIRTKADYGMRSKEQAHDYRYFPEPDLLPLVWIEKWQAAIRAGLPGFRKRAASA